MPFQFKSAFSKTKNFPEYKIYYGARDRCTNPNNKFYHRYGGRGIEFRYTSFEEFLHDVGFRPHPSYSIDRRDNDGHYEPGNVRWASKLMQRHNQ